MHYYGGQIFDGFTSVSDANKFIVRVENDKDFDYNRMRCAVFSSLTHRHMFMVVVCCRVTTLEEREMELNELLVEKVRARSSHDTCRNVNSSSCLLVS